MQCAFKHAWPLLKSNKASFQQKIDGFMILNIYFLPVLTLLSWFLLLALFVFNPSTLLPFWIALVVAVFFALNGNVAPFLEVVAGAICDGRRKLLLFAPLLAVAYVINVFVCSKAFLYLVFAKLTGRNVNHWHKTTHNGLIS